VTPAPVVVDVGGWLFRQRTWLPLPLAVALLLIPASPAGLGAPLFVAGLFLIAAGEAVRLWSVHHIGAISRTRSDRLGPLIASGPFALVRNPLYIGNIALWAGFAVMAGLLWLVPLVVLLLACEYHAIVRWEETLLETRLGDSYRLYAARVHRWWPSWIGPDVSRSDAVFSWRQTLFSERGTLIAIAVGLVLLYVKVRLEGGSVGDVLLNR
jgi:protein-S-isoprenylcysteine O-methyltransferase Ste14